MVGALSGYGIPASAVPYTEGSYTYLRITDINDDGTLNLSDRKSLDDPAAQEYLLQPNDIVFARTGNSTGRNYFYNPEDGDLVYAGFLIKFSIDPEKVNPKYIKYYMLSPKYRAWITAFNTGSTRGNINAQTYANMQIDIPPRKQQDLLVDVLSSLDAKFRINNQINRNLEEQAKAIFKSWFIDFEPFQDGKFVDSELGRIPKGWKVGTLGEIIELHDHKRIPLSSRQRESMDKKYPYYGAASLMDYVDNYLFDGVYTLLGEDGTVVTDDGMPVLQYVWGKFWVNNHAHVLTGKNGHSAETLYILLKNTPVQSIVTGAVQPKISQVNLKSIPIIVAPQDIIRKYGALIEPFFEEIRRNSDESFRLVSIRDTLLTKLMSGEISLKEETNGKQ